MVIEVNRYWVPNNVLADQSGWHQDDTCVVQDWEYDKLKADNESLRQMLECAQGDCRQAMKIIEKLTPEAELYQQIQIAAGSLPSGWEIALRVENGYGGIDLIDPYGTVVDLDNVDESLGESVASAVAFATEHTISSPENH